MMTWLLGILMVTGCALPWLYLAWQAKRRRQERVRHERNLFDEW